MKAATLLWFERFELPGMISMPLQNPYLAWMTLRS
jgi:hypothetical protein